MAEWRAANPDRYRLTQRLAQARRRAKEKGGDEPVKIRRWLESQRKVCHWCKAKCAEDYHIDHIQPFALGGEHVVRNLCIACQTCNIKKSARDPIEFAQSLGLLL